MFYSKFLPAQPNELRILNRNDHKLERKNGSTRKDFSNGIVASAQELAFNFGKRTTIHGLNRLLEETASRYERFIWLITVVAALLGSIYVCLILSERFNEGKLETVVDSTRMPVYRISFPAITVCNLNRLNWDRIDEAKRIFLPNEKSTEILNLFERIIGAYDDVRFGNFDVFDVLEEQPLHLLDHVNFSQVFSYMTWRCEEFLTQCIWYHNPIKCCDIFSKRRSKSGICWSFNTLETEEGKRMRQADPLWPWHTGGAGPGNGLSVRALINPDKHFPNRTNEKGLSVMITEAYVWHTDPFTVPMNTKTMIDIDPVIYFYDNETRSISSEQRQCVFDDERNSQNFKTLYGYVYMIENCQSECHQEYLVRHCNCTLDLLFPPGQYRSCKASDLLCLAINNDYFLYSHKPGDEEYVRSYYEGMVCNCFRNCYSLNYFADVRPSYLPIELRGNQSYTDLDIHFRSETMMVYRTSLVFGWVDLLVAFGGIVGLFLGCSLISGIELAYFMLVELPNFIVTKFKFRRNHQRRNLRNTRKVEHKDHLNVQNQYQNNIAQYKHKIQYEQVSLWNRTNSPYIIKQNF